MRPTNTTTEEDTLMAKRKDFDSALKQIGEFGRHQKRIFLTVSLISLPLAAQMLIVVFVGAVPEWKCPSPSGDILHCRSSQPDCCNKDGSICHGGEFSTEIISIATEWNLVCGNSYKIELSQSIFVAGYMFGVLIFGILSDKYGRRRPWLFAYIVGGTLGIMTGFVRTYEEYIVLRFIFGALKGGGGLITYVLSTESIGPSYRGPAGIWQQAFYPLFYVVLALEAYIIHDWRTLTVISILPTLMVLLVVKSIPESPRWLLSQGRVEEAENILRKIEKENGNGNSQEIFLKVEIKRGIEQEKDRQYGIIELFTHKTVYVVTIIMMLLWCVNSMVYYGLALNVRNLEGNLYLNFGLSSFIELPSFASTQFLFSRLGRRLSLFVLQLGASLSCFLCMFLQLYGGQNATAISMTALGGRFCISASYAVLYVYSAELFPTVVRNAGMALSSFSARLGGMVAPFVVLMGDHHTALPMFVFAGTAFFAGIAGLRLHETQGKRMPQTYSDLEEIHFTKTKTNTAF